MQNVGDLGTKLMGARGQNS